MPLRARARTSSFFSSNTKSVNKKKSDSVSG